MRERESERESVRERERERPGIGPNECLEEGYNLLMVPYSGNHSSSQWTSNFMTKCISPSTLPKERVCVCVFVCPSLTFLLYTFFSFLQPLSIIPSPYSLFLTLPLSLSIPLPVCFLSSLFSFTFYLLFTSLPPSPLSFSLCLFPSLSVSFPLSLSLSFPLSLS